MLMLLYARDVSSRTSPWPRGSSRTDCRGLGRQVIGLGLGIGSQVLGLGLGLGRQVLGLGLELLALALEAWPWKSSSLLQLFPLV